MAALILTATVLPSCKAEKEKPPIPEAQMSRILLDIHLAEAYSGVVKADSGQKNIFGKNTDSLALYYKEILSRYNISYEALKKGLDWYQQHPALMDSVYVRVQSSLDSMKPPPPVVPVQAL